MRSICTCQYKMISKYNVSRGKSKVQKPVEYATHVAEVYALKMSRKIHKKLLTAVSSLIRKLEIWSKRITFHFIPTNACFITNECNTISII